MIAGCVIVTISRFVGSSPSQMSISASNPSKKWLKSAVASTMYSSTAWCVCGYSMISSFVIEVKSRYTFAFSIIVVPRKNPRGVAKPYQL